MEHLSSDIEQQSFTAKDTAKEYTSQTLQAGLATVNRDISYPAPNQISNNTLTKDYQKCMKNTRLVRYVTLTVNSADSGLIGLKSIPYTVTSIL
jgi:hypothetical protein